jgi:hypothetical protein
MIEPRFVGRISAESPGPTLERCKGRLTSSSTSLEGSDAAEEPVAGPAALAVRGSAERVENRRRFVTVLALLSLDLPVDAAVQY